MAANVDVVLVVASLDTPVNLNRIERQLVLAWDSGAKPVVVLTKADTHADPKEVVVAVEARAGRVDVVLTSSTLDSGVDEVAAHLRPNRTAVLLGPSGAGKSTLANRLLEADILATGRVRSGDHKGRHTTTSRDLVVVPARRRAHRHPRRAVAHPARGGGGVGGRLLRRRRPGRGLQVPGLPPRRRARLRGGGGGRGRACSTPTGWPTSARSRPTSSARRPR